MQVSDFRNIIKGYARTNIYNVFINNSFINSVPQYKYLVKDVTYPGYDIGTTDMNYWGSARKIPISITFGPCNITFYSDSELLIRKSFLKWRNIIIDSKTLTVSYYKDFIANVLIEILDTNKKVVDKVELLEAYPKLVSDTTLSAENSNMPFEFTVTMEYWGQNNFI